MRHHKSSSRLSVVRTILTGGLLAMCASAAGQTILYQAAEKVV